MLFSYTSAAYSPRETHCDMPSTREELLDALDRLDERLCEISEEIDSLSADERRLSEEIEELRDTLLALKSR